MKHAEIVRVHELSLDSRASMVRFPSRAIVHGAMTVRAVRQLQVAIAVSSVLQD